MRTIASVGFSILGSGTVSTRTSRLPCQATAFISRDLQGARAPSRTRTGPPCRHGRLNAARAHARRTPAVPPAPPRARRARRAPASARGERQATGERRAAGSGVQAERAAVAVDDDAPGGREAEPRAASDVLR